jgi:gliding motility-associated-like protein
VFLESPTGSGNFVVLDTVTTRNYTHNGLNNEETYCYYIESTGTYGMPGFLDSLVNKSQIACGTPIDTVAPCPPIELAGIESCDIIDDDTNNEGRSACEGAFVVAQEDFFNKITWKRNSDSCSGDAASYNLYFSPMCNGVYELVDSMISINDSVYMHQPKYKYNSCGTEYEVTSLAGCYYLTSVDSIEGAGGGNEGANSTIVETDNCPFYELPNVFTPNADEKNDLFVPCLKYRFIESVDFKVFNKWGQLVFETCNPRIEWNGKDMKTDQQLAEDVYFYTCEVRQICMKCPAVKNLKVTIHIILGAK